MWRSASCEWCHYPAMEVSIYPVTVVAARYGGVYEPGRWLAFPYDAPDLPRAWDGDDLDCRAFWEGCTEPVGAGSSPNDAYLDLVSKAR